MPPFITRHEHKCSSMYEPKVVGKVPHKHGWSCRFPHTNMDGAANSHTHKKKHMELQVARHVAYEAFMALSSALEPRRTPRWLLRVKARAHTPAAISMPGTAAAKLVARSDVYAARAYGAGVRPRDGVGARFRPSAMRTAPTRHGAPAPNTVSLPLRFHSHFFCQTRSMCASPR
jgi:hypothetical protein